MPDTEGQESKPATKRAKHEEQITSNVTLNLSPSARLDAMTRERIDALERDKSRLQSEVDRLLLQVVELIHKNARLEESLSNAEANSVLATILIGSGWFLVSYATFTGKMAGAWANFSAGCLMAGIFLLLFQSFRRWRRG
jgi:hypothetical protein